MSAVTTLAASIAAAAGAVAMYRFVNRRTRPLRDAIAELRRQQSAARDGGAAADVLDYERDPASGVYRQKAPRP